MKNRSSVFGMALVTGTSVAVCLVVTCNLTGAQNLPAPIDIVTKPSPASEAQPPASLCHDAREVVKMYQGGIDKDVITNYVNSSALPFHLNADDIIYLRSLGIPQEITKDMVLHDGQLQQQHQPNPYYRQPQIPIQTAMYPYGAMPPQAPPQVMAPTTPAPDGNETDADDADYGYGYPYYSYGWPYYSVGYGYGWPSGFGDRWERGRDMGSPGFRGGNKLAGFGAQVGVGGFNGGFGTGEHGSGLGVHGNGATGSPHNGGSVSGGSGHGGGGGHR